MAERLLEGILPPPEQNGLWKNHRAISDSICPKVTTEVCKRSGQICYCGDCWVADQMSKEYFAWLRSIGRKMDTEVVGGKYFNTAWDFLKTDLRLNAFEVNNAQIIFSTRES
jgi:hypothetical protein